MLASHDGFMHSPPPYYDICFISCKNEEIIAKIKNICSQLKLNFEQAGGFLFAGNCSLSETMLSGYGKIDGEIFWGNESIHVKTNAAIYGTGNYTCFKFNKKGVFCCHDFFGLGSNYMYHDDEICLVANRPHLASIFAYYSPLRKLNIPYIKTQILGSTTWFRRNTGLDKTCISNLERIPTRKYFILKDGAILLCDRKQPELDMSYDEALDHAIKEIYEDFNKLQAKLPDKTFVFDLSGGKDTRMVISSFMDRDLLVTTANDDRMRADMAISNEIVSIFPNIKYNSHYYGNVQYLDQDTALDAWRSYSFGESHDFALVGSATGGDSKKIAVSGGAGEIYRTSFIYSRPKPKCTIEEWLNYILDKEAYLDRLDNEERETIRNYMLSELLPKLKDIEEENDAMSFMYYWSSMRGHFGNRFFSIFCDSMLIYPQLNMNLYLASRKLSIQQRNEGVIVYDFVKKLNEILASINYFKPDAYQDRCRTFKTVPIPERLKEAEESYISSIRSVAAEKHALLNLQEKPRTIANDAFLNIRICQSIVRIIKFEPDLEPFLMHLYALFNGVLYPVAKRAIASKIFVIDDYICPLKSEKRKNLSLSKVKSFINPVQGYEIHDNKIHINLFKNINKRDFYYAVHLKKGSEMKKRFEYRLDLDFDCTGIDFDTIKIYSRNRISDHRNIVNYRILS